MLDSEASAIQCGPHQEQRFALAVTSLDRRKDDGSGWLERVTATHRSTADVWDWVVSKSSSKHQTVLVAHNLGYDLRICNAFEHMADLGWTVHKLVLNDRSTSMTWRKGTRSIVMVDSMTWFGAALERVAVAMGTAKVALPEWSASPDEWEARCKRDVEILADAWRTTVEWLKDQDLGNFRPTGAGQSWSAFRHRFMHHKLLVHSDVEAKASERRAAWAGRAEAWKHGDLTGGPFAEWDFRSQYATIGTECDIPIRLGGHFQRMSMRAYEQFAKRCAVLATVDVTTDTPVLPCALDGRIVWPVGTFRTTVWSNELDLALERGAQAKIVEARTYRTAPVLADISQWCLDHLEGGAIACDPIIRMVVKHWSRALVGRFGAQWSLWEPYGEMVEAGVGYGKGQDVDAGEKFDWLQVGHQLLRSTQSVDSAEGVVSVMSWVMAETRRRLWLACEAIGAEHVAYVDTDGMILDAAGDFRASEAAVAGLRRKAVYDTVRVLAPRQIVVDGRIRASGVASRSVRVAPDTYEGEYWANCATSLGSGEPSMVRVTDRQVRLSGVDRRRHHLPSGATVPITLRDGVPTSECGVLAAG